MTRFSVPGSGPFQWLLATSGQAAVLILLILAVQSLFRRHLSPGARYSLWLLVVVRLILPVSCESSFSIFNLANFEIQTTKVKAGDGFPLGSLSPKASPAAHIGVLLPSAISSHPESRERSPSVQAPKGMPRSHPTFQTALQSFWALGAAFFLGRLAWQHLRFWRVLREGCLVADPAVLALLEQCRRLMGIRRRLVVIETVAVKSPALYGLFHPRLLLPKNLMASFGLQELRHVFLHELGHVKRHDMALNWLSTGLRVIHWFNPLVWLAFHRMSAERESACDALVLSRVGAQENRAYGQTIIKLLVSFSEGDSQPGAVGILEARNEMVRRIRAIARFRQHGPFSKPALALLVVLGLAGLTDAQTDKEKGLRGATKMADVNAGARLADAAARSNSSPFASSSSKAPEELAGRLGDSYESSFTIKYDSPPSFTNYSAGYAFAFHSGPGTNLLGFQCRLIADPGEALPIDEMPDPADPFGARKVQVLKEVLVDSSDIAEAQFTGSFPGRSALVLRFSGGGIVKLKRLVDRHPSRKLAVIVNHQFITTIPVWKPFETVNPLIVEGRFDWFEMDFINRALIGRDPKRSPDGWKPVITGVQDPKATL